MKPEAKRILLYGDSVLTPHTLGLAAYRGDDIVLCDFSEAGGHVASRFLYGGCRVETVRLVDVLAENLFAAVEAPGCDRMNRLVAQAGVKTAVDLLACVMRKH